MDSRSCTLRELMLKIWTLKIFDFIEVVMKKQMLKKAVSVTLLCLSCSIISGCYIAAATIAATTAGSAITDERSMGKIVDDKVILLKIRDRYNKKEISKALSGISVNVSEGRVMLTGNVENHDDILQAIQIAWEIEGVREVINEIEIKEKRLSQRAQDSVITTQIRAKYLLREGFRSANYTVDANNGTVYLLGIAQNKAELKAAEEMASTVSGVDRVVNHAILKSDMRRRNK